MKELENMLAYDSSINSDAEEPDVIPNSWKMRRIKYIAQIFNGDSLSPSLKIKFSSEDENDRAYISSKDINVNTSEIRYETGLRIPSDVRRYKVAPAFTTLICIEGGSAGRKIAFTNQEICFVNKLACVAGTPDINKFIFYSLKGSLFQSQFFSSMSGLIGGVAISSIRNFSIFIPTPDELETIVEFLDCRVPLIDEAIQIKELQISLFKKRKQIIIRQLVTHGLESDTQKKESGIDWIGRIPIHWKTKKFKYLFSQSRLPVRPSDGVVTSYRDGQVTLRSNRRLDGYTEAILEGGYQGIRKGQLVLNSMDAFEGAIGISDSDGKCTPEYVICDPISDEYMPEYFAYLLREMALAKYIQVICSAVRQRAVRIRFNDLASQYFCCPPLCEQRNIVKSIEFESKKIDVAIEHEKQFIEKLKEYKTTLISDTINGKIKVV